MGINLIPSNKYYDDGWELCPFSGMLGLNDPSGSSIMNSSQPLQTKIIYSHKCYVFLRPNMFRTEIVVRMREPVLEMPSDNMGGLQ